MHKLVQVTKTPFRVLSTTDKTVVVQIDGKQERLSCDRVVEALVQAKLMMWKGLQDEKHGVQHGRADEEVVTKSNKSPQGKE